MHCILPGCLCPVLPVGPGTGGDVQRFAEAVDSVGLAAAAVWTVCSERRAARCLYSLCCTRIQAFVA